MRARGDHQKYSWKCRYSYGQRPRNNAGRITKKLLPNMAPWKRLRPIF